MIAVAAALAAGVAVAAVSLLVVRPDMRVGPRVAPYIQRSRRALGVHADATLLTEPESKAVSMWRPIVDAAADRLSRLVDIGGTESLRERIRHAGMAMSPEEYRLGQLTTTARYCAALSLVALLAQPSAGAVLLGAALGAIAGASRWRARIDKAVTHRRDQMSAEVPTIAELLAMRITVGTAPAVAIRDLAARSSGPVANDLTEAIGWVQDGTPLRAAFERLAGQSPAAGAERLYRVLASSETGTGQALVHALTAIANDARAQLREDLERHAIRRSFTMLIPTVLVMGPVMLLLLAAPIPNLIFGE